MTDSFADSGRPSYKQFPMDKDFIRRTKDETRIEFEFCPFAGGTRIVGQDIIINCSCQTETGFSRWQEVQNKVSIAV